MLGNGLGLQHNVGGKKYMLDTLSNCVFAYSSNKTKNSAPYAETVRRSSDNTTLDIGFLNGTIDNTGMAAFVGVGNGFTTKLYNQVGESHGVQTVDGSQPRAVLNSAAEEGVVFDGIDDFLDLSSVAALNITAAPLSIHFRARAVSGYLFAKNLDAAANMQYGVYYSSTAFDFFLEGTARVSAPVSNYVWANVTFVWDVDGSIKGYVNGTQVVTGSYIGSLTTRPNTFLGKRAPANVWYNGPLKHFLVFNKALTPTEVNTLNTILT